jgi:hypothetical protein
MADGLDVSRLSPADAVVAFRSYARRFAALFTGFADDESPDALLNRPGSDGRSAADITAAAAAGFAAAGEALRRIMTEDVPQVTPEAGEPTPAAASPAAALEAVRTAAERLADQVAGVDAGDWGRTGRLDGREVSALDLVRGAVRAGSEEYRAAERAVDDARRSGV